MSIEFTKNEPSAFQFAFPTQAVGAMGSLMARNAKMAADAMSAFQSELRSFANARMQANMELQSAIAACRDLPEIAALQRDWTMTTAQACMDESRRLAELGASFARDGMAAWTSAMSPKSDTQAPTGNSPQ